MANRNPAPPRPPAHPAPGGRGLGAWIKTHKGPAAAIGAVGVLAAFYLIRKGNTAAASTAATGTTSQTGVTDPGTYGYTGAGSYGGYSGDMGSLQNGLSGSTVANLPPGTSGSVTSSTGSASSGAAATGGATGPTTSKPTAPKSTTPAKPTTAPVAKTWIPAKVITVAKGQTLMSLSQSLLGTTNRTELAHSNGLGTGAGLRTGQKLTVPGHYV